MSYNTLAVEIDDRIAVLTFSRPKVLNAFDPELIDESMRALAALATDPTSPRSSFAAPGRAFSSGLRPQGRSGDGRPARASRMAKGTRGGLRLHHAILGLPQPTIAAVHGYCIGGAFELSLACDVTVAAQSTKFGAPEVKFGSGAVALLLPWIAGAKAAKELLLTGDDQLTADRALALGIVNDVVPDGEEMGRALTLARAMANAAPHAVRLTKLAINRTLRGDGTSRRAASALELDIFIEASGGCRARGVRSAAPRAGLGAALSWRDRRDATAKA
jgi:enoyl-CoA hydratase